MRISGVVILFFSLGFLGCGIKKEDYNQIVHENNQLKDTILKLEYEIQKLEETDRFYYQSGADEFTNSNYELAIEWMNNLKVRFPQSNLIASADKLIKDSTSAIATIQQKEKQYFDTLIQESNRLEIEDAIEKLELYIAEDHPEHLVQNASEVLDKFKQDYEKVRKEHEIESATGIRLVDYSTGWGVRGFSGSRLLSPGLTLKFKNVSGNPVERLVVKVSFLDTSKNEVFDETMDYTIGASDTPLQPDYTKNAYIYGSVGYKAFYGESYLPSLVADIYINDLFYKKIVVARRLRD
jgi:hypothetical protein